jgi:tRNA U34 5-methylaminomethyl-2-thiouridine-forming methyltransferase MnmC
VGENGGRTIQALQPQQVAAIVHDGMVTAQLFFSASASAAAAMASRRPVRVRAWFHGKIL